MIITLNLNSSYTGCRYICTCLACNNDIHIVAPPLYFLVLTTTVDFALSLLRLLLL